MSKVQLGLFLIADISRYTVFLAGSELDHAQEILDGLFEAILEKIRPPFEVSNFQGDAVLAFCPDPDASRGGAVLDAVESIYLSFCNVLRGMRLNSSCQCQACQKMQELDLKVILHYGEYLLQTLHGRCELSGRDVILCHRLLKNSVVRTLGIQGGYALLTDSAVRALDLERATRSMRPHSETYEHLGEVSCFVHDLEDVWKRYRDQRRILVTEAEAELSFSLALPLPAEVAWDYLQRPPIKALLQDATDVRVLKAPGGRTGVGTVYHCAHGAQSTRQTIVDWRPYEYFTVKDVSGVGPLRPSVLSTYHFAPTGSQSVQVTFRMSRPRQSGPLRALMVGFMWNGLVRDQLKQRFGPVLRERLLQQIRADQSAGRLWQPVQPASRPPEVGPI